MTFEQRLIGGKEVGIWGRAEGTVGTKTLGWECI